jgi:hypothetical protein
VDQDLDQLATDNIQLVHFIVIFRLAISAIFITGLAKWFSRPYLHIIMVTLHINLSHNL